MPPEGYDDYGYDAPWTQEWHEDVMESMQRQREEKAQYEALKTLWDLPFEGKNTD